MANIHSSYHLMHPCQGNFNGLSASHELGTDTRPALQFYSEHFDWQTGDRLTSALLYPLRCGELVELRKRLRCLFYCTYGTVIA